MAITKYQMRGKRASGRLLAWLTDLPDRAGLLAGESVSDVVLAGGGIDIPSAFSGDFGALAASYGLTVRGYWRGDLGVAGSQGTGKATWANQSGSSTGMTSGLTDGVGSVGAGLNSKASVIMNGTTQNCAYTMPAQVAPSGLHTHKYVIAKFTGTAISKVLFSDNGGSGIACGATSDAAPNINFFQYDGSIGATTTGGVRNQWYALQSSYMGDATSRIKLGAHAAVSADCGNGAPTAARVYGSGGSNINLIENETLLILELEGPLANYLSFTAAVGPVAQGFWTNAIEI